MNLTDELTRLLAEPYGREVVRWQMIRADMPEDVSGKTLADLGCGRGDDVRRAADEGMRVIGVDRADEVMAARRIRDNRRGLAIFTAGDLLSDWQERSGHYDFALCLSVFAHLVDQGGRAESERFLRYALAHTDALYFETHLDGDGPGPHWLPDDAATAAMLRNCGARDVRPLTTLPVYGSAAWRTTWVASTALLTSSRIAIP